MKDRLQDQIESHREKLDEQIEEGGGCAEAWEAMSDMHRQEDTRCCGDSEKRRGFLSKFSVALSGLIASSGLFASRSRATQRLSKEQRKKIENQKNAMRPYHGPIAARDAFEEHGQELLDTLHEIGLLDNPNIESFDFRELWDPSNVDLENDDVTVSSTTRGGRHSAHIKVAKQTKKYRLAMFVQPQFEDSYALLNMFDSPHEQRILIEPGQSDISPDGFCRTEDYCVQEPCCLICPGSKSKVKEITCCVDSPCREGEKTGCCQTKNAKSADCEDIC
ncbi:hypothetical protein [Haloferax larsenii]|uniref:Uncharacterized protein n=1 Tax=Haloferax larsenii TaxID=302484 RepID=A0A1H7MK65_HALLR|nr:hypothetical protein [Haloferax larsenii]SEL11582.1 hypothetical protein SAMN04488691_1034 [Haloferax larsenii]